MCRLSTLSGSQCPPQPLRSRQLKDKKEQHKTMSSYNPSVISIATPINKLIKSASNKDYQEQQERARRNMQLMWDDAKGNPTKTVGGAFAFVQNGIKAEFHIIEKICPPTERLESWSANVGQGDRKVLMLSTCVKTVTWEEWLALECPKKVQGTMRMVTVHPRLSAWLQIQLQDVHSAILPNPVKVG